MSKMDAAQGETGHNDLPPNFPAPTPAAQDAAARIEELIRAEPPPEQAGPRGRGRPKGAKTRHRGGRKQTKTDLRAQLRASESEREAARMEIERARAAAEQERAQLSDAPGWWDDPEKRRALERAITGTAKFTFDMIARRRGDMWRLTEDELRDGAGSTAEAMLQAGRTFPELGRVLLRAMELAAIPLALFVWYAIVDARLMQEAQLAARGELPMTPS